MDITSCNRSKCICILDFKGYYKSREILRVDSNAKLIKNWSIGICNGSAISMTDESNVIVAANNYIGLKEYSPDGQLISEINPSVVDEGIYFIRHAITLSNGDFWSVVTQVIKRRIKYVYWMQLEN